MSYFYMDTDGGSDANNGTTWALGKLTLEGLLAVMSAGDTGFVQGAATDTAASARTFTPPASTMSNPVRIIGVVDGTTNEPPVIGDLAVTLPAIGNTGSGNDITLGNGRILFANIKIICPDRLQTSSGTSAFTYRSCYFELGGYFRMSSSSQTIVLEDSTIEWTSANGEIHGGLSMYGGAVIFTSSDKLVGTLSSLGEIYFYGVDLSQGATGMTDVQELSGAGTPITLSNCKMPTTYSLAESPVDTSRTSVTLIGCNNTSSQAVDSSIQDYQYEDMYGTIDSDLTQVRTDGADDGASGQFAYAMTPTANGTLEGSGAALKSPWMTTWLSGGANTLTIYIANDGGVDYLEDEAWVEFYTPDSGDTAQHEQTFDPADERLLDSPTAITDDATSTWGGTAANGQKFSATVTTGFEGFAYCRLHVAKRSATPDTVFLCPKIVVT